MGLSGACPRRAVDVRKPAADLSRDHSYDGKHSRPEWVLSGKSKCRAEHKRKRNTKGRAFGV